MFSAAAKRLLEYEARSLLNRLTEVRPFALTLPMVPAAAPSVAAQAAIETFLSDGRRRLRASGKRFLHWLKSPQGVSATPAEAQKRFTSVRLQFLSVIEQFDIFSDALVERSQHGYGEWVGGLEVAATDALTLPRYLGDPPPVICHLDRGAGAAIRRVRTRLPGGGRSPVALVRVPRERMVGSSVASSLVHEVGHQGADLLLLLPVLQARLLGRAALAGADRQAWMLYHLWISEIVADLWSVARVGVTATVGLMGVVSLPSVFVFRIEADDPHPTPWIRVKISAAFGRALYPDAQWDELAAMWESFYPLGQTHAQARNVMSLLESTLPEFVSLLLGSVLPQLGGVKLGSMFPLADRTPGRLRALRALIDRNPAELALLSPTVACAVLGQAKLDGAISATAESRFVSQLLRYWALRSTTDASLACADRLTRPVRVSNLTERNHGRTDTAPFDTAHSGHPDAQRSGANAR
jgi:hypothetical protein